MWLSLLLWALGVAFFLGVLFFVSGSTGAGTPGAGTGRRVGNALQPFTGIDTTHLLNLQSVYEPGKQHLRDQKMVAEPEEDDDGDPPAPGT